MAKKAKILVLVEYYLPGYKAGGPIRAIEYLVNHLRAGFDFFIITRGNDQGGPEYLDIKKNEWSAVGGAQVKYLQGIKKFLQIAREIASSKYDFIYINSFFSVTFSIFPIFFIGAMGLRRRIILAPRGEFCAGAVSIKFFKKIWFIRLVRILGVYRGVIWQASTREEVTEIRRFFHGARCQIAKELAPPICVEPIQMIEKHVGELRVVFISRISRKKNLHFALQVLANIYTGNLFFDIYGPVQDNDYWDECRAEIKRLPANVKVQYLGELEHAQVHRQLTAYHVFFLPTLGENFGYAILEALLAGRPVLVSDQTPWRHLPAEGIGFDVPLFDITGFASAIEKYLIMNQTEFDAVTSRVSDFIRKYSQQLNDEVRSSGALFAENTN